MNKLALFLILTFGLTEYVYSLSLSDWYKRKDTREVIWLPKQIYPMQYLKPVDGDVLIEVVNKPRHDMYRSYNQYSFFARLRTKSSKPLLQLANAALSKEFELWHNENKQGNYSTFWIHSAVPNPSWIDSCFSSKLSVQFKENEAAFPVQLFIEVPKSIVIESPKVYTKLDSVSLGPENNLTWKADGKSKHPVWVSVETISREGNAEQALHFLTPDDGLLAFRDFVSYLDAGYISIEITRLNFQIIKFKSKQYRFRSLSSSKAYYKIDKLD